MNVKVNNNQDGNVLIYVMLTIAAVLSSAVVVSNLTRSTIKQTRLVSNTQAAYYAAESGAEKALFEVRKKDVLPESGDCGLAVSCQWEVNNAELMDLVVDLPKNQSVQFDLFDPDKNTTGSGVESIGFSWSGQGTWLEVSLTSWAITPSFSWQYWQQGIPKEDLQTQKFLYSGGSAILNFVQANRNHRVRVKSLYGNADDLKVNLYSLDNKLGQSVAFPNLLEFEVQGSYQLANHDLLITMPRYSPTMGLFDYVLFSEEVIEK